jgi:IS5 family transposase
MPDATIIPFQVPLPQVLPTIEGNVDYRQLRDQLLRMDALLVSSGLEQRLLEKDLARWLGARPSVSAKAQQRHQFHCRRALRCNIARRLLGEDYRGFAARLADSPLLQYFCGISHVLSIQVPSKTTLQRYDGWWPQSEIRQVVYELVGRGATAPQTLAWSEPVDLESAFLDTTCLSAHIHYPVDWVLLRDATRTLIKAVQLIRGQGLKHRMEEPQTFLTGINRLCIQMTHASRKTDTQRQRKKTLRQMDRLVGTVRNHARRYRDLLQQQWPQTDWTQAQAQQVLRRMDGVMAQLPQARRQARQRILRGQPVADEDKLLSLYEPDLQVIVRHKAGTPVEFGNTLLLAENPQGLILDWELFKGRAPADSALLPWSVGRLQEAYGPHLGAVGADRGFDSHSNQIGLAQEGIYNAVCPRSVPQLRQRLGSWKFKRLQRRRAQIEGRVSIIKNVFLSGRLRCKGFAHRERTVTWTVLVHNLWVLARRQRRPQALRTQAQAA